MPDHLYLQKQATDAELRERGHNPSWKRPKVPKGNARYYKGTCDDCGAGITVGSMWTSYDSQGSGDMRSKPCRDQDPFGVTDSNWED